MEFELVANRVRQAHERSSVSLKSGNNFFPPTEMPFPRDAIGCCQIRVIEGNNEMACVWQEMSHGFFCSHIPSHGISCTVDLSPYSSKLISHQLCSQGQYNDWATLLTTLLFISLGNWEIRNIIYKARSLFSQTFQKYKDSKMFSEESLTPPNYLFPSAIDDTCNSLMQCYF